MPAPKMNVVTNLIDDEDDIEPIEIGPMEFTTVSGIRAVRRPVVNTAAIGGGAVNAKSHYSFVSVAYVSLIDSGRRL